MIHNLLPSIIYMYISVFYDEKEYYYILLDN